MDDLTQLASALTDGLHLAVPPVALAFTDAVPEGVPHVSEAVPAGCRFWVLARDAVFYTEGDDHAGCPIGVMTMGFTPSDAVAAELGGLVEQMESLHYLAPGEAAGLPTVPGPTAKVVYGPLASFPAALQPDAVLVTSTAEQAMVLAEAGGQVDMRDSTLRVHGRPACSAIPRALADAKANMSLGCMGMRTFTGIEPGLLLSVLPAAVLPGMAGRVRTLAEANAAMRTFYEGRAAAAAGA